MIIIGELINTSRKAISKAVEERDAEYIKDIARQQVEAGANYIDVNAGTRVHDEAECLKWLVETVQEEIDTPLCIDSPSAKSLKVGLEAHQNGQPMINSITDEKERYDEVLPMVLEYDAKIISLCMNDDGMPDTGKERLEIAKNLTDNMKDAGVKEENIYLDPLVKPVSVNTDFGNEVLDAIEMIHQEYDKVHTTCGLSNVSFGLPNRHLLNRAFLVMCMAKGMDSVILDPLDRKIMSLLIASNTLIGKDDFCMNYLKAQRAGKLEK